MSDENFSTGVSFDEGRSFSRSNGKTSKVIDLTIKYSAGLIKDEKQAQYVIITLFVIILIASYVFVSSSNEGVVGEVVAPAGSELITPEGEPARLIEPII